VNNEKTQDVLEELVKIVDEPAQGWKPLSIGKRVQIIGTNLILLATAFIYMLIVGYAISLLFPFIAEPQGLLSIIIALTSLLFSWFIVIKQLTKPEDREETIRAITDWNYVRIKRNVRNENWLLLKALLRMKTVQKEFKLSEVYRKYPSLFDEENLVGSLYDLFTPSRGKKHEI